MKSIRTLFITITVLITVAIFTAQAAISYISFSRISFDSVESNLKIQAEKEAAILNSRMTTVGKASNSLADTIASMTQIDDATLFNLISSQIRKDSMVYGGGFWMEPYIVDPAQKYYGPYVYNDSGNQVVTWDYSTDQYDYFQYDWYKNGINAGDSVVFSEPYLDAVTGVTMITASSAISKNGKVIGATTFDIGLDEMQNYVQNIKVGKKGYAYIVTQQGYYWATMNDKKDLVVKISEEKESGIKSFGTKLMNDDSTGVSVVDNGEGKDYMVYTPIGTTGLKLVTVMPETEATAAVKKVFFIYFVVFVISIVLFIFAITLLFNKKIIKPLKAWQTSSEKLSKGDVSDNPELEKYKDTNNEVGQLSRAFLELAQSVKEKAVFAEKVADGDLSVRIEPKSENDILAISMDKVVYSLQNLVGEAQTLTEAAVQGELSTRGNEDRFHGGYRQIISGMNATLDAISKPLDVARDFISNMANGSQRELIADVAQYKGYYGELMSNLNGVLESLLNMLSEVMKLTEEAQKGNLSHRADVSKLNGGYMTLVQGVNETMDAVIDPLNMAADYVNRISKGIIPEKITDTYHGDFNVIKTNLNTCIDAINGLVADTGMLIDSAKEGRLDTRADSSRHQGDFAKVISGINETLDAVINPLNMAANYFDRISKGDIPEKITEEYNGDFNVIKNNLNTCIDAVNNLVDETSMLADAAIQGNLSKRADASKHEGDFSKIIDGINNTLDAAIQPMLEATGVLQEISRGNLNARVEGDYRGDLAIIKDGLNFLGENLKGYIDELSEVLGQMAEKNFTGGIDRVYLGDFAKLKDSINFIEVQLNQILAEINASADQVESGAGQVASTSQGLSQGAAEQAASVEEISATITDVADQTKQNASNASKANDLSLKAKMDAENGKDEMQGMLTAMEEINESSKNISRIVKVIDDIAFQTNILALNAAVEAARAGQHGKGFAVVAEEVRSLAARSAEAARETTEMIENSIHKVGEGYAIANKTADALNKIVQGVSDAVDIVEKISEASVQQATAIGQIDAGINQISRVTQSNTATAEESAAASQEMAGQAQMLKGMIHEFQLKQTQYKGPYKLTGSVESSEPEGFEISFDDDDYGKY
jgi:methyl-accepting chemotaxis protein